MPADTEQKSSNPELRALLMRFVHLVILGMGLLVFATSAFAQDVSAKSPQEQTFATFESSKNAYNRVVAPFFAKHCAGCHNGKRSEGELDLSALDPDMKASTSGARWAMLAEKITIGEMPPEGRTRPDPETVEAALGWIKGEMKRAGKHFARRAAYANGNSVNHNKLFDPKFKAPLDTPTGIRRLSPEIYAALLKDIRSPAGIGQPFTAEGRTTFKDMGAPKLDEPTTVQLIRNSIEIVAAQTNFKSENGKVKAVGFVPSEFIKLMDESNPLSEANIAAAFQVQFKAVLARPATQEELERFSSLLHKNVKDGGRVTGVRYALAAVFLLPEAVFRWGVGAGPADDQGRIRLTPREIAFAVAHTLTDRKPDPALLKDAEAGKLDTKEGVAAAVQRMLDDPKLQKPRILRFFREYFGYEKAKEVFQEDKENPDHDARVLVEDTDRLIEYILEKDHDVLKELLTTNKAFIGYKTAAQTKKSRAAELAKFEAAKAKEPERYKDKKQPKVGRSIYLAYNLTDFPDTQPVDLPATERAGILTQPSWLAANAKTGENHAIFRGKWVRERLLGGVVPDIPITVDAQLPEAPHHTLRERMKVTEQAYCYKCHTFMNPVGLPFEIFDYYGRFRKSESIVDNEATAKNVDKKGKPLGPVRRDVPVHATGAINHFDDSKVAGEVSDAVQMLRKLAESERVEQVFVRHAFRYFLGRNETLGDGPSLQAAHKAYRESGGSMKALIAALLSSDSFLYRVPSADAPKAP
jgi:hypothetical protein